MHDKPFEERFDKHVEEMLRIVGDIKINDRWETYFSDLDRKRKEKKQ